MPSCGSNDEESGWPNRSSLGSNEKEVEAEAVAYLLASRAGVVTGSAAYIKSYAQQANMAHIDLDLIVRASSRIERLANIHYGSMSFGNARAATQPGRTQSSTTATPPSPYSKAMGKLKELDERDQRGIERAFDNLQQQCQSKK